MYGRQMFLNIDITTPSPIVTVNFDAYSVGTYIVEVDARKITER